MAGPRYFVDGKCVFCAKKGCDEYCKHFGATTCVKTLLRVGEELYLKKGLDALGIKYYGLGLYARMTFGYDKLTPVHHEPVQVKEVPASKFESLEERQRKNQEAEEFLRRQRSPTGGVFGVYTPSPVNHGAAMAFQQRHDGTR